MAGRAWTGQRALRAAATAALALAAAAAPAAAHAPDPGHGTGLAWSWDPWVLAPLALAAALYGIGDFRLRRRAGRGARRLRRRAALFWSGWGFAALALLSPLDTVGVELFSVHMVQHEVLMLAAAPLLVLAAPGAALAWALPVALRRPTGRATASLRTLWRLLTLPLAAWLLHALVLWGWHVPALFAAAVENDLVHTAQHASFFLAALVFWASLLQGAAVAGVAILSVFTTAIHSSLLGALLTTAPSPWYAPYLATAGEWGLTPLEDQQLGGLIMWVPAGLVYLAAALWLVVELLRRQEQATEAGAGRPR